MNAAIALLPLILLVAILESCRGPELSAEPAELILVNGNVITMDPNRPTAEAIAVRGGASGEARKRARSSCPIAVTPRDRRWELTGNQRGTNPASSPLVPTLAAKFPSVPKRIGPHSPTAADS